jgi:hypothetical protein
MEYQFSEYERLKSLRLPSNMQYNDHLHDPFMVIPGTDHREPGQGILARHDLRPENGTDWGSAATPADSTSRPPASQL